LKIITQELSAEKDGIPGFIAHSQRAERGPGLLIVHHHYGVTGHLKSVACNFAQLGYTTIVPDLYHLLGFSDHTDVQKKTTDGQFVQVIDRGWRYLLGRDGLDRARVGVLGYCMGGRIAIHFVAATPGVRAFIGYYPSVRDEPPSNLRPRHPNDAAREFQCPSLIFYGGRDRVAPVQVQDRLRGCFLANGQLLEWHFFSNAGHGFALADGDAFDPNLAKLTWPLTVDFLARELENC
jgi:carboxymethylenebutenolidase